MLNARAREHVCRWIAIHNRKELPATLPNFIHRTGSGATPELSRDQARHRASLTAARVTWLRWPDGRPKAAALRKADSTWALPASLQRAQRRSAMAIASTRIHRIAGVLPDDPTLRRLLWHFMKRLVIATAAGAAAGVAALTAAEYLHAVPPMPRAPHLLLRDGRRLAYDVRGDPEGRHTLFWVHGSPSCRLEACFMEESVFRQLDIRLIAFDRPGYGQSDPDGHRTYASFADDLRQLADHMGAARFYVAGMSGGGPYALAAAHYLPDRILGATVNCSAASVGDLTRAERRELRAGFHSYPSPELIAFLWSDGLKRATSGVLWVVMQTRRWANDLPVVQPLQHLRKQSPADMEGLARRKHELKQQNIAEALRYSKTAAPWAQDIKLILNPWPFNLRALDPAVCSTIHLTHGTEDRVVPTLFSRALHRMLPGSHLHLTQGGHLDWWWCDAAFQLQSLREMLASGEQACPGSCAPR